MRFTSAPALSCVLLAPALLLGCATDSGTGGTGPDVQQGPEVSGSRNDTSPPLRDIPPAKNPPGKRIHEVKPIPRPKPPDAAAEDAPDGGTSR